MNERQELQARLRGLKGRLPSLIYWTLSNVFDELLGTPAIPGDMLVVFDNIVQRFEQSAAPNP